jgi:hypothetical protein
VTGVQTCALPISVFARDYVPQRPKRIQLPERREIKGLAVLFH